MRPVVSLRLPTDTKLRLESLAAKKNMSLTDLIFSLIDKGLEYERLAEVDEKIETIKKQNDRIFNILFRVAVMQNEDIKGSFDADGYNHILNVLKDRENVLKDTGKIVL